MAKKTGTIWQRVEKKLDRLETNAVKKAERKVMHQRVSEMVRGMNFWDKCELTIKIWS